jgi:hypothetical protein
MNRQESLWLAANYIGWLVLGAFAFFVIAWIIPLSTSILAPIPLITLIPGRLWLTHRTYLHLNKYQSVLVPVGSSIALAMFVGGMFRLVCFYGVILPYARFFWTADSQCGKADLHTAMGLAGLSYLVFGGLFMWASSRSDVWELPHMSPRDIAVRFARFESVASVVGLVTLILAPAIPFAMWRPIVGFLVGWLLSTIAGLMIWHIRGDWWKPLLVGGLLGEFVCLFIFPSAWVGALMLRAEIVAFLGFTAVQAPIDLIGFLSLLVAAWYALGMFMGGFIRACGRRIVGRVRKEDAL